MEAAGIEPASRDPSVFASTCVVGCLCLDRLTPADTGHGGLVENESLAVGVLDVTDGEPDLATGFWASPAKARSRGYRWLGSQDEVTLGI